ncbi:RimK family alpha-L-glutamate ligase [Hymenobacter sp. B81]|uniref:RimK family alpha-L-glutamate ligase n=1 Tax=Hymenobacter sp. B81 TaxID=3344878 RepID=UPI0037DCE11B
MHLALVTSVVLEQYAAANVANEDDLLANYLRAQGLRVSLAVWSDAQVDWRSFDAVVLKSPWDYFDRPAEFHRWLDHLDAAGVALLNPTAIVRYNADKAYLLDLQAAGVGVVPTRHLPRGSRAEPERWLTELGTEKVVVKPTVGGGAKDTFALTPATAATARPQLQSLLAVADFLVQPFVEQVQTTGEWSLVFFGGELSHCVLKTPKPGDFRVQHYLGGSIRAVTAPPHIEQAARDIVRRFAPGCLYARVDGVDSPAGGFWLMELELIEPFLYLEIGGKQACVRYYQALRQLMPRG